MKDKIEYANLASKLTYPHNYQFTGDGYSLRDGYFDGMTQNTEQLNIKLTKEDMRQIEEINKGVFEGEASNSMIGRILIRKGIQFFKNLK